MPSHSSILLLDDSPGECELFRLALTQTGLDVILYTEQDADAAFHFLATQLTAPAMVQLRASNEGSPRPRVPRAQDHAGVGHSGNSASKGDRSGLPSLILLDWHLRNQNGNEFLKRLRADARFVSIPVVCFTTSDDISDLASAYANGANGFVTKPGTYDQLVECVHDVCGFWLKWNRTSKELIRC